LASQFRNGFLELQFPFHGLLMHLLPVTTLADGFAIFDQERTFMTVRAYLGDGSDEGGLIQARWNRWRYCAGS